MKVWINSVLKVYFTEKVGEQAVLSQLIQELIHFSLHVHELLSQFMWQNNLFHFLWNIRFKCKMIYKAKWHNYGKLIIVTREGSGL